MASLAPLTGKRILVTGATGMVGGPMRPARSPPATPFTARARFANPQGARSSRPTDATTSVSTSSAASSTRCPTASTTCCTSRSREDQRLRARPRRQRRRRRAPHGGRCRASTRSSTAAPGGVYQEHEHDHLKEDAPLGDSHRAAGHGELLHLQDRGRDDGAVHVEAPRHPDGDRAPERPYGDTFGWPFFHVMMLEHGMAIPVHTDAPSQYTRSTSTTSSASLPYMLGVGVDAGERRQLGRRRERERRRVVRLIGDLIDKTRSIQFTDAKRPAAHPRRRQASTTSGSTPAVAWQDGIRRMVETSRAAALVAQSRAVATTRWRRAGRGTGSQPPAIPRTAP